MIHPLHYTNYFHQSAQAFYFCQAYSEDVFKAPQGQTYDSDRLIPDLMDFVFYAWCLPAG
jgi:hypothetical protein